MTEKIEASAAPEKRLFISLITRDISLADAFLDLIDNSINAVIAPIAGNLKISDDYIKVLEDQDKAASKLIKLKISDRKISIEDNASGISAATAKNHVFKFGRSDKEKHTSDRLSVYGIGLKRAMFKMGNHIKMSSNHVSGGFEMDLKVDQWSQDKRQPWAIDISRLATSNPMNCGTIIEITELFPEVKTRIKDGVFVEQLKKRVSRTYAFFLGRIVNIEINGEVIKGAPILISENKVVEEFERAGVSCAIMAGIAEPDARGRYVQEASGFYIFCNGRTVIFGDRGELTGWTGSPSLPLFQPKHRPFVGLVFFTSENSEALPWNTTKTAINQESQIWQDARRKMIAVGKKITGYLDNRYSGDGTEVSLSDLRETGGKTSSALSVIASKKQSFKLSAKRVPDEIKIQYSAAVEDVDKIARQLRRPGMGGAEVGRYTFEYFLKNRVRE